VVAVIGKAAKLFTDPKVARSVLDELFPSGNPYRPANVDSAVSLGVARSRGVDEETLNTARALARDMPGEDAMRTAMAIMEKPSALVDDVMRESSRIAGRDRKVRQSVGWDSGDDQFLTRILASDVRTPPKTAFKSKSLARRGGALDDVEAGFLRVQQARRYLIQQLLESASEGDQVAAREAANRLGLWNLVDDPSWVFRG
jgi:hypothetical protein